MPPELSARSRALRRAAQHWVPSASLIGVAVILLVTGWSDMTTAVVSGILVLLAGLLSPWFFPRSLQDSSARELADASAVPLIYWRPGCVYCLRLRLALGRIGNQAVWVDVSRDADASARVRSANGGDETVPTVFLGPAVRVNPAPSWVRDQLRAG